MPQIFFDAKVFNTEPNETVLDTLLRHGEAIAHGCKAGACQACLMQAQAPADLPPAAQAGLKASQKQLGYFLSCSCKPSGDLHIALAEQAAMRFSATIIDKTLLAPAVMRLRLNTEMPFKAGQYLNIWLSDTAVRSYSIASLPTEGFVELHVKLLPGGAFSERLQHSLALGDELHVQGPFGECIYACEDPAEPLLLAGLGTGLAPLYGVLKNALAAGHSGPISCFVGARNASNLYLFDELCELARAHSTLKVGFVAQELAGLKPRTALTQGDIYQAVASAHPHTKGYRVYTCGAASFVRKMKKQCFLAGAAMKCIHADAFLPCT